MKQREAQFALRLHAWSQRKGVLAPSVWERRGERLPRGLNHDEVFTRL